MRNLVLLLTLLIVVACKGKPDSATIPPISEKPTQDLRQSAVPGKVYPAVSIEGSGGNSYALYRADSVASDAKLPVLFAFDSHGRGEMVVRKYKRLADEHGFLLVASNHSKNGLSPQEQLTIANRMLEDVRLHEKIDESQQFLMGFSGGARVATLVAANHPEIVSIIGIGAGASPGVDPMSLHCDWLMIAGQKDFNYLELVDLNESLQNAPFRHAMLEFPGGHEWPGTIEMNVAFSWMEAANFNQMGKTDSTWAINTYNQIANFPGIVSKPYAVEKTRDWRWSASHFALTAACLRKMQPEKIRKDSLYIFKDHKKDLESRNTEFATIRKDEMQMRQEFQQQLGKQDLEWWKKTAQSLEGKANSGGSAMPQRNMYARILNFLSLVTYMQASGSLKANDLAAIEYWVSLYLIIDPQNPESHYLNAQYLSRKGQAQPAVESLREAATLNFFEADRMAAEPDFGMLRNMPAFQAALDQVKKNQAGMQYD